MLTDKAIQAAKPRARPYKLADGEGLRMLVNPNGSKCGSSPSRSNSDHSACRSSPGRTNTNGAIRSAYHVTTCPL